MEEKKPATIDLAAFLDPGELSALKSSFPAFFSDDTVDAFDVFDFAERCPSVEMAMPLFSIESILDMRDEEGSTLLMRASRNQSGEVFEYLLGRTKNINERNEGGCSALHWVAGNCRDLERTRLLLDNGADPKARTIEGYSPLFFAAKYNENECVYKLLKGASNGTSGRNKEGDTILVFAVALNSNREIIKDLIDSCEDINEVCPSGRSALLVAANSNPSADIVELLLDAGADVNKTNGAISALMLAARNNTASVLDCLLDHGAEINAVGGHGETALIHACMAGKTENINHLLARNADPMIVANKKIAIDYLDEKISIARGAKSIRSRRGLGGELDQESESLLAYKDSREYFELKYRSGAIDIEDLIDCASIDQCRAALKRGIAGANRRDGKTNLMIAAEKADMPELIDLLIENGEQVNAINEKEDNRTAAIYAAASNAHGAVVARLIAKGADINQADSKGLTPLMVAARDNGSPEVVLTLLKSGANAKLRSSEGLTAFDYCGGNEQLKGTAAFWGLNDALFN